MSKRRASKATGLDPLTVGLAGVLILAAFCSWRVYHAAGAVIDLAVDKDTYAMFIVEHQDGTKDLQADNAKLADEVNAGRASLMSAQGEAIAMMVACGLIGAGLTARLVKTKIR